MVSNFYFMLADVWHLHWYYGEFNRFPMVWQVSGWELNFLLFYFIFSNHYLIHPQPTLCLTLCLLSCYWREPYGCMTSIAKCQYMHVQIMNMPQKFWVKIHWIEKWLTQSLDWWWLHHNAVKVRTTPTMAPTNTHKAIQFSATELGGKIGYILSQKERRGNSTNKACLVYLYFSFNLVYWLSNNINLILLLCSKRE